MLYHCYACSELCACEVLLPLTAFCTQHWWERSVALGADAICSGCAAKRKVGSKRKSVYYRPDQRVAGLAGPAAGTDRPDHRVWPDRPAEILILGLDLGLLHFIVIGRGGMQ